VSWSPAIKSAGIVILLSLSHKDLQRGTSIFLTMRSHLHSHIKCEKIILCWSSINL
jgi:hypothetical protein